MPREEEERTMALRERLAGREALLTVLLATGLGLLARLYALGWRTAHWDEARVAIRVLDYAETGVWAYDSVVHGPFLFHVNRLSFEVLGPTDFAMRLPVAVVGGLLPLAAWLFRERLRDAEVGVLALLLAANPVVLYYSRFMRNDVLLAAFTVLAVGFAVRALDTGRERYTLAAAVSLALAATTKEFVVVVVIAWACALVLLADRRLLLERSNAELAARLSAGARRLARGARERGPAVAAAGVASLAVFVFFYAPRPDLWNAFGNPSAWPGVLGAATLGSWAEFTSLWVSGGQQSHPYLPYLIDYARVVAAGGLALAGFALVGFVSERYAEERDVVAFCFYWGVLAALVYPLASDITPAPWGVAHAVVPLAVPAAVGLAAVVERGRRALAADDRPGVALAALVLLLVGGQVGATAVSTSYLHPQDDTALAQFGQPDDDLKPALPDIERAIDPASDDVDAMFYGGHFSNPTHRLPVTWYFEAMGARTGYTDDLDAMVELGDGPPPVVVARERHGANLSAALEGYERLGPYAITLDVRGSVVRVVIFVEEGEATERERRPPDSRRLPAASAGPVAHPAPE
jgi:uncharacterized protein (TIGR03663 family)